MTTYYNAQREGRSLRLNLYGPIGNNPLSGPGITSAWVAEQIIAAGKIDQIAVYINSPGGDVFEGIAIYNELKQFPGQVNVYIMGLAASIASIIAMAGSQRVIYSGAEFMIHQASGMTFGTADDHVKQAKTLRRLDAKLASIYAEATGGDAATIAEMMNEETWMESDDALADGFATHGSPQDAVPPPSACLKMVEQYQRVPLKVAVWQASGETPTPAPEPTAMETMPDEENPKNEEHVEEEETVASLKAKLEALEAKLAAMDKPDEEEEEEQPMEAKAIATAFAHDKAFAIEMISQGKTLDDAYRAYAAHAQASLSALSNKLEAANSGVNPIAVASKPEPDEKNDKIKEAASKIKSEYARNAYLASMGLNPADFKFD